MTSYPQIQNYFTPPPPVIRLKLSFHSNEHISLPGDTWHLMEFSKAPLIADVIEQIKFRFQFKKNLEVNLGMKGANFLKSEKSLILRDEDVITVTVSSKQPQQQQSQEKQSNLDPNSAKRKTGVVGSAPVLTNQKLSDSRPNKKVALQNSSSESSTESDSKKTETKTKSVLFIPRQVSSSKPSAIHFHSKPTDKPTDQATNQISSSSSESSTSSDQDISSILQTVQRGTKHIRFTKRDKQPIRLRGRGRGRAFGKVPTELTNRIGPPPPVGVNASRDRFKAKSQVFVNADTEPGKHQQLEDKQQDKQIDQQQREKSQPIETELISPEDISHLELTTPQLPPRIGDTIVFKIMEVSNDYTPSQSDIRVARVVAYDPNDEKVSIEYTSDTLVNIKQSLSQKNEGKFGMEEMRQNVPASEIFPLSELIDPRILKKN